VLSPVLAAKLVFRKADVSTKRRARRLIQEMPDNLTSPESIRKMALTELMKVKQFAEKETKAKNKFNKQLSKS